MTSFSSTPLPPRVCIFAVESGSATTLFSPQHSLFAAQNALYAFADFLALYDYSTLVSLLTFGHTLTNSYKLQKLNLVAWRHAVAKIQTQTPHTPHKSFLQLCNTIRLAMDALPRISHWNLVLFTHKPPLYLLEPNSFQPLSALDQKGLKINVVVLPEPNIEALPASPNIATEEPQDDNLTLWAQLQILFKTSLVNAKLIRFDSPYQPSLENFVKQVVAKLVKNQQGYHKQLTLHLSDTSQLRLRVKELFSVFPGLSCYAPLEIRPATFTAPQDVFIGSSGIIEGAGVKENETDDSVDLYPLCRISASQANSLIANSLPFQIEASQCRRRSNSQTSSIRDSSTAHLEKTSSKSQLRSNRMKVAQLIKEMKGLDQSLVIWTYWQLEKITLDGIRAKGLLKRFYVLKMQAEGVMIGTGIVSMEQQMNLPFSITHPISTENEDCNPISDTIEDLETQVIVESIPEKRLEASDVESGLHAHLESIVWHSTPQTIHHYID